MSGLAGVVPLAGAPADPLAAAALEEAMPGREPISLLAVDPAMELELAADLQLHNGPELRTLFAAKDLSDEETVLAAYRHLGEGFIDRMIGDFAIAVLDRRRRRLLLACDFIGSRPLAYAKAHGYFAFASDPAALVRLPGVDGAPDDHTLVLSLIGMVGTGTHTQFRGVKGLPGGHCLSVDLNTGRATSRRWWDPQHQELRLPRDSDYEERFRAVFFEAVRCRIPTQGPIGTDLSGGLDSSSVTAVAAALAGDRRVVAVGSSFAAPRFDEGRFDEGRFRRMLTDGTPAVDLVEVDAGSVLSSTAVDEMLRRQDAADAGVLLLLAASRYRAVAERGGAVVLDGYDGDVTVNFGFQRLVRLAATLRWGATYRELASLAKHNGAPLKQAVRVGLWMSGVPWVQGLARANPLSKTVVRRDVLESSGVAAALRAERPPLPGSTFREQRFHLLQGFAGVMMGSYGKAGWLAGVEVRHPYYDRRLVELCMSLPEDQHMRNGWTRWIVRRSMDGVMPDTARWRGGKAAISPEFVKAYADAFPVQALIDRRGGHARDLLDQTRFEGTARRWQQERPLPDAFALLAVAQVDRWLATRYG